MTPRPILKNFPSPPGANLQSYEEHALNIDSYMSNNGALPFASSHIPALNSPHVHFPPTPSLIQLGMTHSSRSYDRKPIDVQPNSLALPERGERDTDCGYFYPTGYIMADADSECSVGGDLAPPSPRPPANDAAQSAAQLRPFETVHQQPCYLGSITVYGRPAETCLSTPLSGTEIPAAISVSLHFSPSSLPTLMRKRSANEFRPIHRQKMKLRREFANGVKRRVEHLAQILDENPDASSLNGSYGHGLGLGLEYVSEKTDHRNKDSSEQRYFKSSFDECLGGF